MGRPGLLPRRGPRTKDRARGDGTPCNKAHLVGAENIIWPSDQERCTSGPTSDTSRPSTHRDDHGRPTRRPIGFPPCTSVPHSVASTVRSDADGGRESLVIGEIEFVYATRPVRRRLWVPKTRSER